MPRRFAFRIFPIQLLTCLAPHITCGQVSLVALAETTGSIAGTVKYVADSKRPWRLGRYYIRNAKSGEIAEAVVAISARGLNVIDATREPQTAIVDQKDFQFTPETTAIRTGDRVRFLNSDNHSHRMPRPALHGPVHGPRLITAPLHEPRSKYGWTFFSAEMGQIEPGKHSIVSRAIDVNGRVQPTAGDDEIALKKTYWEA